MMHARGFWKLKHAIWFLMAQRLYRPIQYDRGDIDACLLMDSLYGGSGDMHGERFMASGKNVTV
jgi:hypothetical protein